MNPFLLNKQERFSDWKSFRDGLSKLPEKDQLNAVAKYWSLAPVHRFAYDVERPNTWPTAWEMIYSGDWCENSVAIGMEFTLRLAGWNSERLHIMLVKDREKHFQRAILLVDGVYVLNESYGDITEYRKGMSIICDITFQGKHYDHALSFES